MRWIYFALWIGIAICGTISSGLHEKKLAQGMTQRRVGFWEQLWVGVGSIACYQFFETIW